MCVSVCGIRDTRKYIAWSDSSHINQLISTYNNICVWLRFSYILKIGEKKKREREREREERERERERERRSRPSA